MIAKQVAEVPPPVSDIRDDVPEAMCRAISRGLAKDPAQRFGSVSDFSRALNGQPVHDRIEVNWDADGGAGGNDFRAETLDMRSRIARRHRLRRLRDRVYQGVGLVALAAVVYGGSLLMARRGPRAELSFHDVAITETPTWGVPLGPRPASNTPGAVADEPRRTASAGPSTAGASRLAGDVPRSVADSDESSNGVESRVPVRESRSRPGRGALQGLLDRYRRALEAEDLNALEQRVYAGAMPDEDRDMLGHMFANADSLRVDLTAGELRSGQDTARLDVLHDFRYRRREGWDDQRRMRFAMRLARTPAGGWVLVDIEFP